MSKKLVLFISISLALFLVFGSEPTYGHHQKLVLGEATDASELVFPPVTSGAGFILPDSPLFFLDKTFQQIRLLTAFTPARRAKLRAQIANERLAELRIMLSRNNPDGINTALTQLNKEVDLSVDSLSDASAQGKDVSLLARDINNTIKMQRKILGVLENQAKGVLKLQLKTLRKALKDAKVEVEDELPEDELENEIEDNLNDDIEDELEEASGSAKRLEHAIDVLSQLASKAAEKQQVRREEALRHAIEVKNDELRRQAEKLLEKDIKRQERLLKAHERARHKAREAIEKTQEVAEEFEEAQDAALELKEMETNDNSGQSGSSGSSESNPSDSDSDNSGSSDSGTSGSEDSDRSGSNSGKE